MLRSSRDCDHVAQTRNNNRRPRIDGSAVAELPIAVVPQHSTIPLDSRAQVCSPPTETSVARPPASSTVVGESVTQVGMVDPVTVVWPLPASSGFRWLDETQPTEIGRTIAINPAEYFIASGRLGSRSSVKRRLQRIASQPTRSCWASRPPTSIPAAGAMSCTTTTSPPPSSTESSNAGACFASTALPSGSSACPKIRYDSMTTTLR